MKSFYLAKGIFPFNSANLLMESENFPKEIGDSKIKFKPAMSYGASAIPHYKKRKNGGEDCHYASEKLLVVIDGVGGWNQVGIDPAEYSRELCNKYLFNLLSIQELFKANSKIDVNTAKRLIVQSAKKVKTKGSRLD